MVPTKLRLLRLGMGGELILYISSLFTYKGWQIYEMMMNVNRADESAASPKFKQLSVPMHSFDVLEQGMDHGCNLDIVL